MKKTIKTEYLEERIQRLKLEYQNSILRWEAENSISQNLASIKERQYAIDGARLIVLGIDKVLDLVIDITK